MTTRNVKIIDATLREGNQAPGVLFTVEQSKVIARLLERVGVDTIECGHPAASELERARVRALRDLELGIPILGHARAQRDDIDRVADAGAEWVGIFAGLNPISLDTRFSGRSGEEVLDWILRAIDHAKRLGLRVRYTLEDASRTSTDVARRVFARAIDAGADRLCFADTLGVMSPEVMAREVERLRAALPKATIEVHVHDDRGLALACALKAVESGAGWISASVNGLGERCGITDLAAFLANLDLVGDRRSTDFDALQELSTYVGAISREPPDARRPVVGRYAFTHTAKLHTRAVARDEMAYSWRRPALLGRSISIASPPRHDLERLVIRPQAICATELKYHRSGPGTRYVLVDDRFVANAKQYCIIREIPRQAARPERHVDNHRHNVDSLFIFAGNSPGLRGLKVEVVLEGERFVLDSPATVLIPAGVLHSYEILEGEGYFLNHVQEGSYHKSLLETHELLAHPPAGAAARAEGGAAGPPLGGDGPPRHPAPAGDRVSFEQFTGAVADFIARKADLDRAKIHPDYDFLEAGLLDSVSLIELFFFVEEKFGEELLPGEFQMAEMNTPANFYQRYVRTQEPAGHAAEI